ncbi:efflux RND transporter permease subunit [Microaerobacter geothermalis]|uniref:efflux RND transporter permease subunit n=1 Tax=Microaerobacter geothermalis TaxID=674972 RepID=UPI001F2277DC|nr:efflux RND transporter permease subunit [Microaerobacter geothermalis]MCF6094872.1 efflux RND transporter permease subunit [Microaerobacter geothermalis]
MIAFLLKYQKITLLFFVMAVLVGAFSFAGLKQRENPEIALTVATVTTVYPGASPEKVEQLVTKPLEEKINEMDNIASVKSTSMANLSYIVVELKPGGDNQRSWDILRQKVQSAESELPDEAEKPVVNDDLAGIAQQILHVVVEKREEIEGLRPILENWKDQLNTVEGVSNVSIVGLPDQEISISLDAERLAAYGLPWGVVYQSLENKYNRVPLGTVEEKNRQFYLNLTGEWETVEDIGNTVVYRTPSGVPVKLKEVATVELSTKKRKVGITYNGRPAVDLVIRSEKGVDIPSLQDRLDKKIEELKKQLPVDVEVISLFNQKESINRLFSELGRELLIGMVAVIIVCSLGLTIATALIVALAIPISIAIGFIPLDALGIDLNQITIASLVIVLGILVDDAIVVNDNIERRLSLGDPPFKASVEGSRDVAISITTATIATAAAFFPLFFLKGDIGDFIKPIPVVVSLTLGVSMIMSLTIVPIFRQWMGERQSVFSNRYEAKSPGLLGKHLYQLSIYYEKQIHRFLRRPLLTGVVALAVGTSSFGLLPYLGVQYFPNAEREEFLIDFTLPTGNSLAVTEEVVEKAAAWVKEQPGVVSVSAYAGRTTPKFYNTELERSGVNEGQLFVKIDRKVTETKELITPWRNQLQEMFPGVEILPRELESGPPVGAPVAIRINGTDLEELRKLSQEVQNMLYKIPGAVNISDDMGMDMYTVDLELNKEKASLYGISDKDLSTTVRLAVEGVEVAQYQKGDQLLDVTLYSGDKDRQSLNHIERLLVPSANGEPIPLSEIVSLKPNWMTKAIHHNNLTRTVTVRSYAQGRLPDEIMTDLNHYLQGLSLPPGYFIEIGGETEERDAAFTSIGKLSLIVLLLIYIIIAMQFYSLSIPILILSTVYLAGGGAIIGLFITREPIGFMALMGMVSLSGIVVRNGIVLIEFIEQARKKGLDLYEAVATAGKARLRPILLTMATAVFGLTPMAILGGSLWGPMAVTIISGLIFSTALTLVVVPSLYVLLAKWRDKSINHPEHPSEKVSF